MLNITNHSRNATFTPVRIAIIKKPQTLNAREKGELPTLLVGCTTTIENSMEAPLKKP